MADSTIRLAKISAINYTSGKARVIYEDRDQSVSSELPFLAWQYSMPKINDLVAVACFSNGTVSGVILGPIYNEANKPYEGGNGVYRQELSNTKNKAVVTYSDTTGIVTIRAPKLQFEGYEYADSPLITLNQIKTALLDIANLQTDVSRGEGTATIQAQINTLSAQITSLSSRITALGG